MLRMDTPLRAPSSADGRIRIVSYLELPPGQVLDLAGEGLADLVLPAGSSAARVEYLAPEGTPIDSPPTTTWRILDVRATHFEPSGEVYSVTRPAGTFGHLRVEWPKAEHARGTIALVDFVRAGALGGGSNAEHARLADKIGSINDCPSCHAARVTASPNHDALVKRGTDASGLYSVLAVLRDEGPFETYRPRDMNEGDDLVDARCATGARVAPRSVCPDGRGPVGTLRVAEGIARSDPHAMAVCATRRALAARTTSRAHAVVAPALLACQRR